MSRRIKHLVETLCKMVLKSTSSKQKKLLISAQNNTTITIDNPAIRIDNGTIRIAYFIGFGQRKRQTWSCANHQMISCEQFGRSYIVSSSQRKANSDIPDEKEKLVTKAKNSVSRVLKSKSRWVGGLHIMMKPCVNLNWNRILLHNTNYKFSTKQSNDQDCMFYRLQP